MQPWLVIGLGLVLGIRHAADADHVVAVTAIASRHKRVGPAALVGALWGLGHTLTVSLVGGLILLLNLTVPPRVGLTLEFAVGIALTAIGLINLAGRGGFVGPAGAAGRRSAWRAFAVGVIHGLAGSAAVALLVLGTVATDVLLGCAYLLVFGAGTILGMMLITIALAAPVAAMAGRFSWSGERLRWMTGALSLAFGVYVVVHIGWVDGLFRARPQ